MCPRCAWRRRGGEAAVRVARPPRLSPPREPRGWHGRLPPTSATATRTARGPFTAGRPDGFAPAGSAPCHSWYAESIAIRNPVNVLPVPVGDATSTSSPARMGGQADRCGWVGPPGNRRRNQPETAGCRSSTIEAGRGGGSLWAGSVITRSPSTLPVRCDETAVAGRDLQ